MLRMTTVAVALVLSLSAAAKARAESDDEAKTKIDEFNKAFAAKDESARVAAVEALAPVMNASVSKVLAGLLARDTQDVRIAAAKALGRVADDAAITGLSGAIEANKKMPEVQKAILSALGSTDSEKALPAIHKMFDKYKDGVAAAAVDAADKICSPASIDVLMEVFHKADLEKAKASGASGSNQDTPNRDIEDLFDPTKKTLGDITGGSEVSYKGWKEWYKKEGGKLKWTSVYWCPGTQKEFDVAPGAQKLCPNDGDKVKGCGVFLKKKPAP